MPRRVLKIGPDGKAHRGPTEEQRLWHHVHAHRLGLPDGHAGVAVHRLGNKLWNAKMSQFGRLIDKVLEKPMSEDELRRGSALAKRARNNPLLAEEMERSMAAVSAASQRSVEAWLEDLLRRGTGAEEAGKWEASISALKAEAEHVPPVGMPKKDAVAVGGDTYNTLVVGELKRQFTVDELRAMVAQLGSGA